VSLAAAEDIVYVPDQPNFIFDQGVTVAGWFKPTQVGGTRTLIRKRDKGTSSFALVLNQGRYQFVISLGSGVAVSVTAPTRARANQFEHVAGTYDGQTLRLYIGGLEVNSFVIGGSIPLGPGPLLIGNDGNERRMNGLVDDVIFEGSARSAEGIRELLCTRAFPSVVVTPSLSPPTPAGTPASFDVAITNNNHAFCPALSSVRMQAFSFGEVTIDPSFTISGPIASGATEHIAFTATALVDTTPGIAPIIVFIESNDPRQSFFAQAFAELQITEPTGCFVREARELMITDVSVVDDLRASSGGPWSFRHLMEGLAPTPADAPALVERLMRELTVDKVLNGFPLSTRIGMQLSILNNWPRNGSGELDLDQAPLRLQAIVHRFDLRDLAQGHAGEGRFVFAFEELGFPLLATLILEYKLPAASEAEVLGWANDIHALGSLPFGEEYNAALAALTERFAGRGARPSGVNGSALAALRTNEISLGGGLPWELREFHLDPADGFLAPAPLDRTPDRSFNFSTSLTGFINENAPAILAEQHTVPLDFNGAPFQAAAVLNDLTTWFADGVDPEARHKFALNTCNGCHSTQETNTFFTHISPRFAGSQAALSPFLTGTTVFDPFTGQPRELDDLQRRADDLEAIVCASPGAKPDRAKLVKGIDRVH
jgi:hypothetical protein